MSGQRNQHPMWSQVLDVEVGLSGITEMFWSPFGCRLVAVRLQRIKRCFFGFLRTFK
jgi:hypothetical protein